jgi:phage tail-like protein
MGLSSQSSRPVSADPFLAFRFSVEVDQQVIAGFSEVTGLSFETEVETFREGGVNEHEWQIAGPTKFPSRLVLKRGLTRSDALWSWYQDVMGGSIRRKQLAILMMDSAGDECRRWLFLEACPVKWTGPEFRANSADIAFESVELVHRGHRPWR